MMLLSKKEGLTEAIDLVCDKLITQSVPKKQRLFLYLKEEQITYDGIGL